MATHYTCGVAHFFSLRFVFQPERSSEPLRVSVRQASWERRSSWEKAE